MLPRNNWIVEHGLCQKQEDFLLDEMTNTLCCPSPDNCCPNTNRGCLKSMPATSYGGVLPLAPVFLRHDLTITTSSVNASY